MNRPPPHPALALRTVAIVGRPNVGKSALFNRLAGRKISIVHDRPGVTRDRLSAVCHLGAAPFEIIDTGGIGAAADATFAEQIHTEADIAMATASLILLVVDAREGLTPVDGDLARRLRRFEKPVVLVVNKVDTGDRPAATAEFARLGFERVAETSAEHDRGIAALVAHIEHLLPAAAPPAGEAAADGARPPAPVAVAVIGRPNVGKSSLINAVLQDRRTIVSAVAGTTRDAIDIPYRRDNIAYTLIDTAGIRARGKVRDSIEVFSVMRAEKSIRRADLCTMIIDAAAGVTAQDKKVAALIREAGRPCIVVANKWDLVPDRGDPGAAIDRIRRDLFFLDYAPVALVSAKLGRHLSRFFQAVDRVRADARRRLGTGPLNRLLGRIQTANPPPVRRGHRFRIFYATQTEPPPAEPIPVPTFVCFVNDPAALTESYRKYLENQLRAEARFAGLPLRLQFRSRRENPDR